VLYQLSYLAACGRSLAARDLAQAVDERLDQVVLHQHGIRAGLGDSAMQLRVSVAGERDQTDLRVILPHSRHRRHAVDDGHVQVDHDRAREQRIGQLDRIEPVRCRADDRQLRLTVDQRPKRRDEGLVVVGEDDPHRSSALVLQETDVNLGRVTVQPRDRRVALIGAPLDLGAGRRGVDMGPSAIRYAGLEQHLVEKLGIETVDLGNVAAPVAEALDEGDPNARFLRPILELCDRVAKLVAAATRNGQTPLVLGGDHSVALGSLVGMASVHGAGGVIWLDAHGDLNTPESSPSGNVHGMPLAAALGLAGPEFAYDDWTLPAIEPGRIALVGVRSLDEGERELLKGLGAKVFTMSEIDRIGIEPCMRDALAHAAGGAFLHVSLDMDVVDPDSAPGVGTPVRGGLSYREAHLAMEIVADSGRADSFDVVEVNPVLDRENATGKLAVELVASGLGARIL
jgi:arginase